MRIPNPLRWRLRLQNPLFLGLMRRPVDRLGQILLFIITLEAALMASGRLVAVGPVTAKMALYLASMGFVIIGLMLGMRLRFATYCITISFASIAVVGSLIGILNGAKGDFVMVDNRAYAYIPAICFFDLAIRRNEAFDLVSKTIRIASVPVFAVCTLIVLLVLSGQATIVSIATVLEIKYLQDFSVTQEGLGIRLYYEGYIYLAIAAIFWAARPNWRAKVFALLITILITLSGTRGLTLALILCFTLLIALNGKRRAFSKLLALGVVILSLAAAPFLLSILRGRDQISESDETRIATINEIENDVTVGSLIWGHGLGIGVPERPDKMEITYLEIFHKNGLIGLAVWSMPFVLILKRYVLLRGSDVTGVITPFVLGALLVCLDSFTNPALNNPIGLSMVFMCYGVLGQAMSSYREEATGIKGIPWNRRLYRANLSASHV